MKCPVRTRQTRPRGFTLIELLTVIAIIAILAALLFPAMAAVQRNMREGACMSNMHSIIQGIQMYKDDYRIYPDALFGVEYRSSGGNRAFATRLYPQYVKDAKVFTCPESPVKTPGDPVGPATLSGLVQPTNPATGGAYVTGVYNVYLAPFSSYDFQYIPSVNPTRTELRYTPKWSSGGPGIGDNPRQLIYKNPPDSTVVTTCLYHANLNSSGVPERGKNALVGFLSGRVQKIDAAKLAWPGEPGIPPWQVTPK
jgi:prepilin-type N-terminal cleavage/methylation domain-containing protein